MIIAIPAETATGEKRVALPMSAFEARARDGGTQLVLKGGSKDMLANAPAYEKAK